MTSGLGLVVPLPSNDIAYSPLTGKLYASVPGYDALRGNTITEIDPASGELGRSIWVGSDPGPLAVSDDGATMYVGLTGASSVRRVDLITGTPLGQYQVGLTQYTMRDRVYAEDLAVLPGDPDSVAIVRREVDSSGDDGVGIYTHGVMRPGKTNSVYGPRSLAFSDSPSRLYGYDNYTSAFEFSRLDIGPDGVTVVDSTERLLSGFYANIHFDGGRIYSDSGQVIDPERLELLGTFPISDLIWSRAVVPDLRSGVVYAAGSTSSDLVVRTYDPDLFVLRQSTSVLQSKDVVGRIRLAGPRRVAMRVSESIWDPTAVLIFTFDEPVTHQLIVSSSGAPGAVPIDVTPADTSGLASGVTPFERRFPDGEAVTLTAPASSGSKHFDRWQWGPDETSISRALTLTLSRGYELVAIYRDPAPTVTSVTPSSGPTSGGTLVTITGTGFQPGAIPEIAHYYPLTDVAVVSATTITARTPAVSVGTYSLYVTNPDYQYGILNPAFSFANLPGYFVKSSPAQATSGTPGVVVLSWTAAPNASRYEYCLDSTVNGACDGTWVSTSAATRAFVGPLTALVTYEWQARAVSAGGTTDADGAWWTFTVAADPGCAPGTRVVPAKPVTTQGLAGMWQPTGLSAVAGRTLSCLVAPGQTWMNGTAAWSAAGNAAELAPGNNVPLTGAPRMALIGRVGPSGAPFVIGSAFQAIAVQSGEIFLAPNDDWYALHDNAGSLAVTVCPGETPCTLDGTASVPATAAPGELAVFKAAVTSTGCLNALTYAWDFGDGTSVSAAPEPSHAYAAAGTYAWSATVRSGSQQFVLTGTVLVMEPGSCVPTTKSVQAKPVGGGLAGMWQATGVTVRAGDAITLGAGAGHQWSNGGASWTAAGNAVDVVQGPNCPLAGAPRMALVARIGPSGTPFLVGQQRQVTAPAAGEIYLAPNDDWYMVWDNAGALSVSICAGGSACSVDATATVPLAGTASAPVAFSATATATGCAGSPTYEWDFGDGSAHSTEQTPSHVYAAGTYSWILTVRAGLATATRTGSITVTTGGGCAPVSRTVSGKPAGGGLAGMWQAAGVTVRAGESLSLSAGSQTWANGGRSWTGAGDASDVVTGQNGPLPGAPRMALVGRIGATGAPFLVGVQKELIAASGGELYFAPNDDWYLLWDNAGTLSVSVCTGPAVCTVEATAAAPAAASAGEPVGFAGTASATACAGAPAFEWDFGEGSPAGVEASPTHIYAAAGTYTWTLTVRADAATITRSGTILVREPGSCSIDTPTVFAKPSGSGLAGMWQATGITVAAGDVLTFDAAGGQTWVSGSLTYSAEGNGADVLQGQNCPLPGSGRMALVGRIGDHGTPFLIGQHRQITATAAGQLYLAPNDDWYLLWDNAGALVVSVCR
jgi:PKD repeat protein